MPDRWRVLLAACELRTGDEAKRNAVLEQLKACHGWWHYMDSTWLLITSDTPQSLADRITSNLEKNDRLLVIEVMANYQGWLPEKAWEWINTNVLGYAGKPMGTL